MVLLVSVVQELEHCFHSQNTGRQAELKSAAHKLMSGGVAGDCVSLQLTDYERRCDTLVLQVSQCTLYLCLSLTFRPVWVPGCKNRHAPFPGRMSYKATKPGSVCPVS